MERKEEKYGRDEKEKPTMNVGADNFEMSASRDCYLDMEVDAKTERYFTGEKWK